MKTPLPEYFLPLSEVAFEILLSLADGERHGYELMKDIEQRTEGRLKLHPGTLYRSVARLVDDGLVESLPDGEKAASADERRRPVRITELGTRVGRAEAERLARQVTRAKAHRWVRRTS
jgi:DNA-binding PadR family transcriptional regulator